MDKKTTGKLGEKLAISYLKKRGDLILCTNFHSRYGELDIVSLSPSQELIFIEVKTRCSRNFGIPEEALTAKKMQKIFKTAIKFMEKNPEMHFYGWRIDLIAIELGQQKQVQSLKHYKNLSYG